MKGWIAKQGQQRLVTQYNSSAWIEKTNFTFKGVQGMNPC
jgi:hypothetical protein